MVHGDGADVDEFGQVVFVGDLICCQFHSWIDNWREGRRRT